MTNTHLFLDDVRDPREGRCSFTYRRIIDITKKDDPEWTVVRSYKAFVDHLEKHGLPKVISFDHDLDEKTHVQEYFFAMAGQRPLNRSLLKDTGYDCALYLIEFCKKNSLTLPKFYVHSANTLGAQDIQNELKKYELFQQSLQSPHLGEKPSGNS